MVIPSVTDGDFFNSAESIDGSYGSDFFLPMFAPSLNPFCGDAIGLGGPEKNVFTILLALIRSKGGGYHLF